MSNELNILINKITEIKLNYWYNRFYKNWDKYYLSDEYKLDIIYIIQEFKNYILGDFKTELQQEINNENDEYIQDRLIIILDNYDNTFEYVAKCYDDNIYYPNSFNVNWIFDLFNLKDDNIPILK